MAERSGSICTENERFFACTLFPFIDSTGVENLRKEIGFKIDLVEVGANKTLVTKAVRDFCNLPLKEAKDLVESLPKTLKDDMPKTDALVIKKMLEDVGAEVKISKIAFNKT
jgi:ribosomal protein L7/L12